MSNQDDRHSPAEPLDELVTQLLECGAVLSQIVGRMVEFQAAGRSAPDAAPIPEIAHSLIRGVLDEVGKQHSKRDIRVAAAIVAQTTEAMGENIFFVGPDLN
jgi:hypothetical protein